MLLTICPFCCTVLPKRIDLYQSEEVTRVFLVSMLDFEAILLTAQ